MSILYISEQGAKIKKESSRIFVEKDDIELLEIQTRKISAIVVMGNIQITTQSLTLLTGEGIPITFLSLDGKIKGELLPILNKNLHLRYDQYNAANDDECSFKLAKYFVTKKIRAYTDFYRKLQKNEPIENCKALNEGFSQMVLEVEQADNYKEILGYEGAASRIHFSNYGKFFKNELTFSKRSQFPPEDEVNALLSFGYTMLFKLLNGMLHSAGFDIYSGFLHKNKYNRPSLTCDFQELFRVTLVDALILKLANKGILKKKHFTQTENEPRLTQDGLTTFFSHWKQTAYPTNGSLLIREIEDEITAFIKIINSFTKEQTT